MRFLTMLVLTGVCMLPVATPAEAARRHTRCCLELPIPDVPPGPICVQVRSRGWVRPRRACRLLGGRPIGKGDCSLAACRPGLAGGPA
jgi:hypothetical protein